jgi:hypothetical protein
MASVLAPFDSAGHGSFVFDWLGCHVARLGVSTSANPKRLIVRFRMPVTGWPSLCQDKAAAKCSEWKYRIDKRGEVIQEWRRGFWG